MGSIMDFPVHSDAYETSYDALTRPSNSWTKIRHPYLKGSDEYECWEQGYAEAIEMEAETQQADSERGWEPDPDIYEPEYPNYDDHENWFEAD